MKKRIIFEAVCLFCLSVALFPQSQKNLNGARVSVLPPTVKDIKEVALDFPVARHFGLYVQGTANLIMTEREEDAYNIQRTGRHPSLLMYVIEK